MATISEKPVLGTQKIKIKEPKYTTYHKAIKSQRRAAREKRLRVSETGFGP